MKPAPVTPTSSSTINRSPSSSPRSSPRLGIHAVRNTAGTPEPASSSERPPSPQGDPASATSATPVTPVTQAIQSNPSQANQPETSLSQPGGAKPKGSSNHLPSLEGASGTRNTPIVTQQPSRRGTSDTAVVTTQPTGNPNKNPATEQGGPNDPVPGPELEKNYFINPIFPEIKLTPIRELSVWDMHCTPQGVQQLSDCYVRTQGSIIGCAVGDLFFGSIGLCSGLTTTAQWVGIMLPGMAACSVASGVAGVLTFRKSLYSAYAISETQGFSNKLNLTKDLIKEGGVDKKKKKGLMATLIPKEEGNTQTKYKKNTIVFDTKKTTVVSQYNKMYNEDSSDDETEL